MAIHERLYRVRVFFFKLLVGAQLNFFTVQLVWNLANSRRQARLPVPF